MTKELQNAGVASNSREAHSQAESFFKGNAQNKVQENKKQEVLAERGKETEYLVEQKVKLLVNMYMKNVAGEIQEIHEKVHSVVEQVALLRQEMASLKGGTAPSPAKKEESKKEEPKKETNPRQGNFTSEDVSIEKMFYFGRK